MEIWNAGGYSFETDMKLGDGNDDDEMAAFEAECAKMLEQEHERRARDEKAAEIAKAAEAVRSAAMPEAAETAKPETEPEPDPATAFEPEAPAEPQPQPEPPKSSHRDELVAIMQAEANESMIHEAILEEEKKRREELAEEKEEEDPDGFPRWLAITFSVLLMILGAVGIYTMIGMEYHSHIFDPLCFIEVAVCLLTAVGLITSPISFRVGKEMIMRLAGYALFAFYTVYAADALFLKNLLAYGINTDNAVSYAKSHINMDVAAGLSAMGTSGMVGCALFVAPFAFMLLILLKPFRNFVLYLLTVAFLFFAVEAVRILTMSGSFNLSQGLMGLSGAMAAYILFILPPVKRLLNEAGLILWDFDEDDE